MAAAAPAPSSEPKRKPGWMTIPGGPKEPNFQDFKKKFDALVQEKKACFEALKDIRNELDAARGANTGGEGAAERQALRSKIGQIDGDRKKERDNRRAADERIKEVRAQRRSIESQLQALTEEVGAFSSVEEIDAAIDLVMLKLETGTATLKAEKECIKRLSKLEDAKALLSKLEPLEEAIAEAEERELDLQQESRDIHARIAELNAEYEKSMGLKQAKDKEASKTTVDFSAIKKKRETVSEKIEKLNAQIDELRADFDKASDAWKKWRIEAQEKFKNKIEAERAERERAWKEKQEAERLARRRAKAAKKLNPHKWDIEACSTLISYLEQKVKIHVREAEEAEKRKKAANFDAAAAAPAGTRLAGAQEDDEWVFADRTKKAKGGAKPAKKAEEGAKPEVTKEAKKKPVHHSQDKQTLFKQVNVSVPESLGDIEAVLKELKEKKKAFEAKIILNPDDVDVTSSDDEAGAAAEEATAVASTAAPAEY